MDLQAVKAPDSDQFSMEAIVIDIIIITMFYLFYFPTGTGAIFHKNNGNENSMGITTQLYSFTHPICFSAAGFHRLGKFRCEHKHKHNITNYTACSLWRNTACSLWRRQKRKSIKCLKMGTTNSMTLTTPLMSCVLQVLCVGEYFHHSLISGQYYRLLAS